MDESDHVAVKYKFYVTDDEWKPSASEPRIELFCLTKQGKQVIPRKCPKLVPPKYQDSSKQNFIELDRCIRYYYLHLSL